MTRTFYNAMLAAVAAKNSEPFLLTVAVTADDLQYGVTPYWNAGGGCYIEWGDGNTTTAATSGATIPHTYGEAGTYIVAVIGDMYRLICAARNPAAITYCNGNWSALGNITNGNGMFSGAENMEILVDHLPPNLTNGQSMFYRNLRATLPLKGLPEWLTTSPNMFQQCEESTMNIRRLPSGLTGSVAYMFHRCRKMTADLDAWVAANPNGWAGLTNLTNFARIAGSLNSPGSFTGSISAFEALCPNVTNWTDAFYGTNTTA